MNGKNHAAFWALRELWISAQTEMAAAQEQAIYSGMLLCVELGFEVWDPIFLRARQQGSGGSAIVMLEWVSQTSRFAQKGLKPSSPAQPGYPKPNPEVPNPAPKA